MTSHTLLRQRLYSLDQANYAAYKSLQGHYDFPNFTLRIDRIQADPFAAPSQCRVQIPQAIAQFPTDLFCNRSREIALRDYLTRRFAQGVAELPSQRGGEERGRGNRESESRDRGNWGSGNSGLWEIAPVGQTILERTTVFVGADEIEVRFGVGLPALGRRIAGRQAVEMLCDDLPVVGFLKTQGCCLKRFIHRRHSTYHTSMYDLSLKNHSEPRVFRKPWVLYVPPTTSQCTTAALSAQYPNHPSPSPKHEVPDKIRNV